MRKCPFCAEEIQTDAVKCKHCGSWLSVPPGGYPPESPASGYVAPARLVRSSTDRMIAGNCGGLARYLGIDPTLVRILVAVGTFFTAIFPGIILYVILAFVIPSDDPPVY